MKLISWQTTGLYSTSYSKHFCSARQHLHDRGNSYLKSRVLYTANKTSSFQFNCIVLCGDAHPQPGAKVKYPCKECQRYVRSNQNVILCANRETWSHTKCVDWICNWCSLPFNNASDLGFNAESNISNDFETPAIIQDQEGDYANVLLTGGQRLHNKACSHDNNSCIIDQRKENSSNALRSTASEYKQHPKQIRRSNSIE